MLKSMKSLKGYRLHAIDGYIGDVRDIHFASDTWEVQNIYAHTVRHLPIHEVLIPRDRLGEIDWVSMSISVNQTRREIWHDPPLSSSPPLYQRVKDQIAAYYLWAPCWLPTSPKSESNPHAEPDESCTLQSFNHMMGYRVMARDDEAGRIDDFIVDDSSWRVRIVAVDMGSRVKRSRPILAPVEHVTSISFAKRSLQLDTELERLKEAPYFEPVELHEPQFAENLRTLYERQAVRR